MDIVRDKPTIESPPPHTHQITPLPEEVWMVDLANNEKSMLTNETINIRDEAQLKESTTQRQTENFMLALRTRCTRLVEIFNHNKGPESNALKQFKIAGSKYDFMLFRNTLKLVFSTPKPGVVDIYFSSYLESSKAAEEANTVSGERLELTFGPFDEPYWALKGHRINLEYLARKFLTDFVLLSCR